MTECPDNVKEFMKSFLPEGEMASFLEKCRKIGEKLYEANRTMNLTRIPEEKYWILHAADSLAARKLIRPGMKRICDMGCGAGFPSLILAAACPEIRITAVDSTRKKADHVQAAAEYAGLENLEAVHARANELARKEGFREAFDMVTARAVSDAETIFRESWGFLRRNGLLCIFRTLEQAEKEIPGLAVKRLKPRLTKEFTLPEEAGTRLFLLIEKSK